MKEYEKLLADYKTRLGILKDDIEEYIKNPSTETLYPILEAIADIPLIKKRLIEKLPKKIKEGILEDLLKRELEIVNLLEQSNKHLAETFAKRFSLHASSSLAGETG